MKKSDPIPTKKELYDFWKYQLDYNDILVKELKKLDETIILLYKNNDSLLTLMQEYFSGGIPDPDFEKVLTNQREIMASFNWLISVRSGNVQRSLVIGEGDVNPPTLS